MIHRHCRSSKNLKTHHLFEVEKAIISLKDIKAAGLDNIHAEVIKYGECALHRRLHNFILHCWSAKCLLQQWENANIILVHKQKGDRAECGNSRGISLLSVAGKCWLMSWSPVFSST